MISYWSKFRSQKSDLNHLMTHNVRPLAVVRSFTTTSPSIGSKGREFITGELTSIMLDKLPSYDTNLYSWLETGTSSLKCYSPKLDRKRDWTVDVYDATKHVLTTNLWNRIHQLTTPSLSSANQQIITIHIHHILYLWSIWIS